MFIDTYSLRKRTNYEKSALEVLEESERAWAIERAKEARENRHAYLRASGFPSLSLPYTTVESMAQWEVVRLGDECQGSLELGHTIKFYSSFFIFNLFIIIYKK